MIPFYDTFLAARATIATILFLIVLTSILLKNRKKVQIQKILWYFLYFALYKTKLGLKQMDSLSKKHPKVVDVVSKIGVFVGVLGIFVIAYLLVKNILDIFVNGVAVSTVGLVLPFAVRGAFYVPFFYWIISIFFIAVLHEFCHGVVARLHNVPVKSSGFAFLGVIIPVIPAAFVEPDEKVLAKRSKMQKLSVFAAGPFSNILSGALIFGLFLLLSYPVVANVLEYNGVSVQGFTPNSSAEKAGMPKGATITQIDTIPVIFADNLSQALDVKKVGDPATVVTTNGTYNVILGKNPDNASLPYLGVLVSQSQKTRSSFTDKYGSFTADSIIWFMGLLYWIFTLSIGIGLFNLVPVGPIDGGLMSKEIFGYLFKNEKTAMKAWSWTSMFFFLIILINLLAGFIKL